jgi:hypothetical protein
MEHTLFVVHDSRAQECTVELESGEEGLRKVQNERKSSGVEKDKEKVRENVNSRLRGMTGGLERNVLTALTRDPLSRFFRRRCAYSWMAVVERLLPVRCYVVDCNVELCNNPLYRICLWI